MPSDFVEPGENDNIECHLQQTGMGTLICRAAKQTGDGGTNEVNPTICFNCVAGKIYREVGCDSILPKIRIYRGMGGSHFDIESLFCAIRKRDTDLEVCRECNLVISEATKQTITVARGLFQYHGFYSSFKDIEKARTLIRDGKFDSSITCSISCVESTMRICHEKLGEPLPKKISVVSLWKSTRALLDFDNFEASGATCNLTNALHGLFTSLGNLRNELSDAHGKGTISPTITMATAELALNTASTLATTIIRRFEQVKGDSNE